MNKQFLTSNHNHFKRDILLIFLLSLFEYILDISTSKKLYTKCSNFGTQSFIFLHHFIFIYSFVAWISNNRTILIGNCILILAMLYHWFSNNDVCEWTRQTKIRCGIDENLRTFFKIFFPTMHDNKRVSQKTYLFFSLLVSVIKLLQNKK